MTSKSIAPRRILVPIDLYGINRGTLETLVRIARQLDQGLLGLLLEDTRLQQVADLPFTTEITLSGGQERSLLRDHLAQRHSLVSTDARQLLNELAQRSEVELSFENASGSRWHSAAQRDGDLDIFLPARQYWHAATRGLSNRAGIIKRLGVVLPEGQPHEKLVNTAATLLNAGLVGDIYVLSNLPPLPEQLHNLYRPGHQVRLQRNFHCDAASVTALIRQSPYDLLLLSGDCLQGIPAHVLEAALDNSGGQVMIIN
ncbi:MAG: hypothetical protein V7700_00790 [Halioglobus sp.]